MRIAKRNQQGKRRERTSKRLTPKDKHLRPSWKKRNDAREALQRKAIE